MPRTFTITTPAETVRVANGKGEMVFTVTNTSGAPTRALGKLVPLGETSAAWLSLEGDREREFAAGAVQQFRVTADVPAGTAPGRYTCRLDIVSAVKSGEDVDLGPVVAFEVPASAPVEKKPIPWWVWVAAGVAALLVGATIFLLTRGPRMVQVPPVVGERRADAEKAIAGAGLVPAVVAPREGRIGNPGVVVAQEPKPLVEVEEGATVTIEVVPPRRPTFPVRPVRPSVSPDLRDRLKGKTQ